MTLRLALLASGLMFAAACDDGKSDSAGSGDDGEDDGGDDGGDPGGPGGPGGDGGDPGGDPGGDGGDPGGDPGGDGGDPGGDPGGDGGAPSTWEGGWGVGIISGKGFCDLGWWSTSGTAASVMCDGCDFGMDLDATWDLGASACGDIPAGDNFAFYNSRYPDIYEYAGTWYDGIYYSADGTEWLYLGGEYDVGHPNTDNGYIYYRGSFSKTKYAGYYYFYHGYGNYE